MPWIVEWASCLGQMFGYFVTRVRGERVEAGLEYQRMYILSSSQESRNENKFKKDQSTIPMPYLGSTLCRTLAESYPIRKVAYHNFRPRQVYVSCSSIYILIPFRDLQIRLSNNLKFGLQVSS